MDPDTRRLMMFAAGLGGLLVVMVGASAFIGRHGNEVPVVLADTRPIREKPLNPGGMKIDGAENDVFSGGSDTANAKLGPAQETPDTKTYRAAETASPPVAASAASTVQTLAAVAAPPAPRPAVAAIVPPVAKPAPAKAIVEAHPPATGHQPVVQLAALTSEEAARNEWQQLSKRMPDLLHGRQPNYSRTERDGHTFWRVRTAGFADLTQARSFCEHVRAKGAGCSVADF